VVRNWFNSFFWEEKYKTGYESETKLNAFTISVARQKQWEIREVRVLDKQDIVIKKMY